MKRFYILFLSALIFAPSLLFGATNIDDNHIIFTWGYGEVANDILQVIKDVISLLQLTNKSKESFHINILINSDTLYKNPLLQYNINRTISKDENIIYALKNTSSINQAFKNLKELQEVLLKENIFLNFIDLNSKESLLSFYNQILSNHHLKDYFYIKNNQFFIKEDIKNKIVFHNINSSSIISNYLSLLNDFNTLSKIELINILESLSLYNLSTLMQDIQKRYLKLEYNLKSFDKDSIFLSNMIMNVRLK
ncbi:hypothetical protein L8W40_01140 [Campylobacter sp. IFREMER_LSEM_CL1846]|uniref:hypothetical protein n=1 Tax=Campylobacter sp. IFREMER_LSEM_CL1846 TaxID=2911614 RepID=UPI0021E68968|nr:hypothetical protein [Campylobacter sp. IFREMER_LSEM_CL1846]MCV3433666.1 hypothetical protein [Campylobacter sp. IFREMER_LSEM_CL1846]